MAQASTKPTGHRPQNSRILPAIPRALTAKPRQQAEQSVKASDASPHETPLNSQDGLQGGTSVISSHEASEHPIKQASQPATPLPDILDDGNVTKASVPQATSVIGEAQETRQRDMSAGHANANYDSGLEQLTKDDCSHSPTTASEPPSNNLVAVPDRDGVISSVGIPRERMHVAGNGTLIFAASQETAPSPPSVATTAQAQPNSMQSKQTSRGPQPGAVPFIPKHAYHHSEPFAGSPLPRPSPPVMPGQFDTTAHFQGRSHSPYCTLNGFMNYGRPAPIPRNHGFQSYQPRNSTPPYYASLPGQAAGSRYNPTSGPKPVPTLNPPPTAEQFFGLPEQQSTIRGQYSRLPLTPETPKFASQDPDAEASTWLSDYLHGQFGHPDFADIHLRIAHSAYLFGPTTIPAHGVLLARSPKLRSLMAMPLLMPPVPNLPFRIVDLTISDRFLCFEAALAKAIMRLYADALLNESSLPEMAKSSAPQLGAEQGSMRFALAYAAAGHFLQIGEIVSRGLDLAAGCLSWKNIDSALAFSLDGGLGPSWHQREGSQEDRQSSSSSDGSQSKLDSPASPPTYGYYSDRMLQRSQQFIVEHWPAGFSLHRGAPQLQDTPRLPYTEDTIRAQSRSHLTRLRFGEMTVDEEQAADPVTATLSSILVSLPLPVLKQSFEDKRLIDSIGSAAVADLTRAVVAEREQRRKKAAAYRDGIGAASAAVDERLWHNLRFAELVEDSPQSPSGVRIARQRLGSDTPPTSADSTKS